MQLGLPRTPNREALPASGLIEVSFDSAAKQEASASTIACHAVAAIERVENLLGPFKKTVFLQIDDDSGPPMVVCTNRNARDPFRSAILGPKMVPASIIAMLEPKQATLANLAHEFTHVWLRQHLLSPPQAIEEGIAYHVENNGTAPDWAIDVIKALPRIDLTEFLANDPAFLSDQRTRRAAGWAVVDHLLIEHGLFLKEVAQRKKFPDPNIAIKHVIKRKAAA